MAGTHVQFATLRHRVKQPLSVGFFEASHSFPGLICTVFQTLLVHTQGWIENLCFNLCRRQHFLEACTCVSPLDTNGERWEENNLRGKRDSHLNFDLLYATLMLFEGCLLGLWESILVGLRSKFISPGYVAMMAVSSFWVVELSLNRSHHVSFSRLYR